MADDNAQDEYEDIRTTWRTKDEATKRSMIGRLENLQGEDPAFDRDLRKLIDEISTELRLEELEDAADSTDGRTP